VLGEDAGELVNPWVEKLSGELLARAGLLSQLSELPGEGEWLERFMDSGGAR
jgi:hypothetical protein